MLPHRPGDSRTHMRINRRRPPSLSIISAAPVATAKMGKAREIFLPLAEQKIKAATPGEIFWFITKGDVNNGMPSWATLPQRQRWLIVNYVKTLGTPQANSGERRSHGTRKGHPPERAASESAVHRLPLREAGRGSQDYPERSSRSLCHGIGGQWSQKWWRVPRVRGRRFLPGFKVEQYATGLENPRMIRTAPNGDVFVAETRAGDVRVFRGITSNGKPEQVAVFRQRPEPAVRHQLLSSGSRSRNGSTWRTRTRSCAFRIRTAI